MVSKADSKHKTLEALREENNGYNPEKLEHHHTILNDLGDELYVVRNDTFNNDKSNFKIWVKTSAENEEEFIIHFPKTYGLIYNNHFYVRDEDFYT